MQHIEPTLVDLVYEELFEPLRLALFGKLGVDDEVRPIAPDGLQVSGELVSGHISRQITLRLPQLTAVSFRLS